MCGIAGIFSLNDENVINQEKKMQSMLLNLKDRGPDSSGYTFSKNKKLILGNNRLSIVDLNNNVPLPFIKNNSDFLLSFNGEIYNYKILRDKLISKGVHFNFKTDTEVLYEMLKMKDLNALDELEGMWGFSFYDNKKDKLILSRDLLGERHIFYTIEQNRLIFASNAKSILGIMNNPEFNFNSSFSSFMYGSSEPGKTLIKKINRLLPGHNLIIENNKIKIENYKKLNTERFNKLIKDNLNKPNKIKEKFLHLFTDSLKKRIPEEVKYCFSLSGGLDSSLNCIVASQISNKKIDTFFMNGNSEKKDGELNEKEASKYVSNIISSNYNEYNFEDQESFDELNNVANNSFDGCIDDGIASFSILAKKIKYKKNKVIIMSDGPDELLGGYNIDLFLNKIDNLYLNNDFVLLTNKFINKFKKKLSIKSKSIETINYNPFQTKVAHQIHEKSFLNFFYNKEFLKEFDYSYGNLPEYYEDNFNDNSIKRSLCYASKSIPDFYNLRMDKAFMENAIEVRQPFLEPKLVEFMMALPKYYRFKNNNNSKYLLRSIIDDLIGSKISKRTKYGYANHLWDKEIIKKKLNIDDRIGDSLFFKDKIFNSNIKDYVCNKDCHYGIKWSIFSLVSTFENIEALRRIT